MVLHGAINMHVPGYGSQDTMKFNSFTSASKGFSPLRVQRMSFLSNDDFFHGQLYGWQVTINSIYGLDMVAKKSLWWPTWVCSTSYLDMPTPGSKISS